VTTVREATAPAGCAHCGLPVPKGLLEVDADHQFCCAGCRTVYQMIHACGLDPFYAIRDAEDWAPEPARSTGRRYVEFDDPAFTERFAQTRDDGLCVIDLRLEQIHCAACVWLIEKLPAITPGIAEARLTFRQAILRVVWDPQATTLSRIARTLDGLGYPPHPARDTTKRSLAAKEDRRHLIRIAVAGAAAGNVMLMALALYSGHVDGIESQYESLFRWGSMLIGWIALLWPGGVFFRGAWAAIQTRTPHLDLPIALGLSAGAVSGTINTVMGRGEAYFDSLVILVFLLLVGRFIQHRHQRRADDAVELLFALTPMSARRVRDGRVEDVPIDVLQPGDLVEVRANESVPADGVIDDGASQVDQSLLTGESRPVGVCVGQAVNAGTVNLTSTLRIAVRATGEQTRVGRLMRMVEQATRQKAPIVQLADRIALIFVGVVVTLATATLTVWWVLDPSVAVDHAVALLIVACPCALGLATPLALAVAIGRAARREILIKGADTLERLSKPGSVLLDKTGTITAGRATLVHWLGDEDAKVIALSVERHSSHHAARALVRAFENDIDPSDEPAATDVTQHTDGGIEASVNQRRALIGSARFLENHGVDLPYETRQTQDEWIAQGLSPVFVAIDGLCVAAAALGDAIRPDAAGAIRKLRELGWRVGIISGDHPHIVAQVAEEVGVEPAAAAGAVSPEQKVAALREDHWPRPVVMVGDGVNDAAALAAADVGVAVHGGAEASLAAADIYLARAGLDPIVQLITGARGAMKAIRRSLGASLTYNAVAVALAAAGLIHPIIAAILMPLSSLTVLWLAFSTPTFKD
jgi:Cu2+-exporting ATPase